ncbi:MAG: DUF1285 domain-containing protein [Aestuariivita sp.]|nr:DUF1285 domain-containing protein [Aestuariivita sp.]
MSLQTNPTSVSIENLVKSTSAFRRKALPPVHLWNPPFCGELDIRIARNGTWFYLGTPIGRPELVRLFSSILKKEGDRFFLVTPVEKVSIKVDDAPFVAVDFVVENSQGMQILTFETHVGDFTTAGKECPIHVVLDSKTGEPSPYVRVRSNLEALIDRKSFYRLVDYAVHHEGWFGVWSSGLFFPIIASKEINAEI